MSKSQSDFRRAKKGAKFVGYPITVLIIVWLVSAFFGCSVDEGGGGTCDVMGLDVGPFLNTISAAAGLVFIIVAIPATLYSLSNLVSGYIHKRRELKSGGAE